jgi:hypothetical protein
MTPLWDPRREWLASWRVFCFCALVLTGSVVFQPDILYSIGGDAAAGFGPPWRPVEPLTRQAPPVTSSPKRLERRFHGTVKFSNGRSSFSGIDGSA